jgi:hypothetical protein
MPHRQAACQSKTGRNETGTSTKIIPGEQENTNSRVNSPRLPVTDGDKLPISMEFGSTFFLVRKM